MPQEKGLCGNSLDNVERRGYDRALADVKAILSKVEVDKEKLIEIIGNTKTTSADGVTKYKTIDILGLCELDEIASAIAKDLPIKE